jgi:hypothetical protein
MIRIPKNDIERSEAFKIPYYHGIDIALFIQAQQKDDFNSLRMSSFSKRRVWSFEKFKAYIEHNNGKVFLDNTPTEQLYVISACNLQELENIMYGGSIPIFCQDIDFKNDVYVRNMNPQI